MKSICTALIAIALGLFSVEVQAATPTYFNSRALFEGQLTSLVVDDYSNAGYVFLQNDAQMSAVLGETDYEPTGHINNNLVFSQQYCAGCNGSFRLHFTTTSATTDGIGVAGVGVDMPLHSTAVPYFAFITFGDGTTANIALPGAGSFWAVIAPELIVSVHFGLSGGATTTDGSFAIDNLTIGSLCGNGLNDAGEECDDGNLTDGDGCSASCDLEYCGNGSLDPGEVCDDGNTLGGDGCSADCASDESCGNGYVDIATGEACDDGNTTDGDGCQANCALPTCGDGILDVGEICDDGNNANADGCNATCTSDESCGNNIVDGAVGEQCDDGNTSPGDGCNAGCMVEYCGNGVLEPSEQCDDGNVVSGDGCSSDCASDETCGNGIVDVAAGEQCDDGNTSTGDGCSADCAVEYCGNGVVDGDEVCDDGNTMGGDGCSSDCASDESCGNGYVDVAAGEACDDGNTTDGDGCSASCAAPGCGDGVADSGEACDDGNNSDGDGCNATCTSTEICGNGIVDVGELCDQGADNGPDGPCSSECDVVVAPGGSTSAEGDGCGCEIVGAERRPSWLALLALSTAALALRRRRGGRRQP